MLRPLSVSELCSDGNSRVGARLVIVFLQDVLWII